MTSSSSAMTDPLRTHLVKALSFDNNSMVVELEDGRELKVPLEQFPKLLDATASQRSNWRKIGGGSGVHWPELDEDLFIPALFS